MKEDAEIKAMGVLKETLGSLDEDTRVHVIKWAADRFGVVLTKARGGAGGKNEAGADEFPDLGSLFTAARPGTEAERALVVGYWFQVLKGQDAFDSGAINSELKNLGHGVKNITRAFDDLKGRRPSLAIQIQKSGKAKQARKKYKITEAGITRVKQMLAAVEPE